MSTLVENVTCLGCGCACDDITVVSDGDSIRETRTTCTLGSEWFRQARSTSSAAVNGRNASFEQAVTSAAQVLRSARRPLVYVAPGLSCEEQRVCTAIADVMHARLDSATTATSPAHLIASQERGFASATFGEVRNRADLVIYWAVDVTARYPRFVSRYAPSEAATVVAVDVGAATATVTASQRFAIDPAKELATLIELRDGARQTIGPLFDDKRYIALMYDAEPDERENRSFQRFDALIALAQSLNERTRCAAIALRAGGNRSGADSVFTAQTGYPAAIDFARGYPRYRPHDAADADAALVVGDCANLPKSISQVLASASTVAVGPSATATTLGSASIAIDTGAAGIHTSGTVVRSDDVPLPLRPPLRATRSVADVLRTLLDAVR